jgi:origin recognition complex subunit 1
MEMRHPFEAYIKLWGDMNSGENSMCSAETAMSNLEACFTGKKSSSWADHDNGRVIVVLLDEIDYLVTKKQTVLYDFFDWPVRSLELQSKNRLIVIGVSNTLNLPERLHPRVQSRIGSTRIFFKSYAESEINSILKSKIQTASPNYDVFQDDAIQFVAKKIAAQSGDIRKAFHICRTAADMILNDAQYKTTTSDIKKEEPIVSIMHVHKISRDTANTAQSRAVAFCAPFEALLLVSLACLSSSTGRENDGFDVGEITTKMESISNAIGNDLYLPAPNIMETLTMLSRLGEAELVSLKTSRNATITCRASFVGSGGGAWPLVSLIVDRQAVQQALKDTCHNEIARKYLVVNY